MVEPYATYLSTQCKSSKLHIFSEGHKNFRNLPLTFDCMYSSQKKVEDFAKFCGLLRICGLYLQWVSLVRDADQDSLINSKLVAEMSH